MEKERALALLPYWERLSGEQKQYIAAHARMRRCAKGEAVHGYGEACLGTVLILQGTFRVFLLSEEGREITLFRLGAGEPCVLSASCVIRQITFDTHMVAESEGELLVVGSAAFDRVAEENIYVKCFLYETATRRFSDVMWAMQQILFLKMDRRLALFLLGEYERTGSAEIRMTHEQIAVHISSAREVVARMLKRFEADGLVRLRRGSIILVRPETLRAV